jgi:hypothetical protein
MEYPDKEEEPYRYAEEKLKEVQRSTDISKEERELIYRIGRGFFCVSREVENFYIEESYIYLLDTLEVVCNLILKKRNNQNKIPIIKELADDSEKVFEKVEEVGKLIGRIIKNTKSLESKIVSDDIINQMKIRNQNP